MTNTATATLHCRAIDRLSILGPKDSYYGGVWHRGLHTWLRQVVILVVFAEARQHDLVTTCEMWDNLRIES
jgi:hypothetical protein